MKKILLSLATLALSSLAIAQNDIVISEIMYNGPESGTDTLEFIELYNNGTTTVDLTGWSFSQGVTFTFPSVSIAAGEYIVTSYDSIKFHNTFGVASYEWGSGGLSNGGEDIVLINSTGATIDSVDYDDSTPWPTSPDGSGNSLTLCDYTSDNNDGSNWFAGGVSTGVVVAGSEYMCSPGATDGVTCTTDPIISFDGASVSVNEAIGTVSVNLTLTNSSSLATSVDVVLSASSTVSSGDYTFTNPTTVTFPANSTTNQMITVTIIDDMDVETTELLILELQNFTNSSVAGLNPTYEISIGDNDESVIPGCSELYFSEYIEGSSSNKAIEIYNPTASTIDLSNYSVYLYGNGATIATDTLMLTGTITAGDVFIIASPSADSANIRAFSDTLHSVCYFNGDDALSLFNGTTQVDVIGLIGTDPGASWSVDTGATKEYTLVRKASIVNGTTLWTGVGDTQWIAYSQDDFSHLGMHTTDGCASMPVSTPVVNTDTVCLGSAFSFSENSTGGVAPYTYNWEFGDGNTSSISNPTHTYAAAGTYTVTLWITESSSLGQVDDSTITVVVDPCTSIEESLINNIGMYPNPTKDGFVTFSNVLNNTTVTVYNLVGAVVYNNQINNAQTIDFSNLNKGSYIVSLTTNSNTTIKKLIIE